MIHYMWLPEHALRCNVGLEAQLGVSDDRFFYHSFGPTNDSSVDFEGEMGRCVGMEGEKIVLHLRLRHGEPPVQHGASAWQAAIISARGCCQSNVVSVKMLSTERDKLCFLPIDADLLAAGGMFTLRVTRRAKHAEDTFPYYAWLLKTFLGTGEEIDRLDSMLQIDAPPPGPSECAREALWAGETISDEEFAKRAGFYRGPK